MRLTIDVGDNAFRLISVETREGLARSYIAEPQELQLLLVDPAGRPFQTVYLSDPRRLRYYDEPIVTGPAGETGTSFEHAVMQRTGVVTVFLPFTAPLTGVDVVWPKGRRLGRVDLTPTIRAFCQRRTDPECRQWLALHP